MRLLNAEDRNLIPSEPILLPHRFSLIDIKFWSWFSTKEREKAPSYFIELWDSIKSNEFKFVRYCSAEESDSVPYYPISFFQKFNLRNVRLFKTPKA